MYWILCVYYDSTRIITAAVHQLTSTFTNEAPSKIYIIYDWFNVFKRGRRLLTYEFKQGVPESIVLPENTEAVRKLIKQHRPVIYRKIEAAVGMTRIHSIFSGIRLSFTRTSWVHIGWYNLIFDWSIHEIDTHPPCGPDLAPYDFFLLLIGKNKLHG